LQASGSSGSPIVFGGTNVKQIATLAALLLATAASAQEAKKPQWTGAAGAGLVLLTGNSSTLTASGTLSAQRETNGWILGAKGTGVYGRARPSDRTLDAETVAAAATGQLRADRKLGEHATVFVVAGLDTDHVASIEYRAYGDGGFGWIWLDRKGEEDRALFLRTDLGVRYAYESRWQYYPTAAVPTPGDLEDVDLVAPRAGASLRWALSKDTAFTEDAEVLANVSGDERYLAKSITKITTRLASRVGLGLAYVVAWDSAPAAGKVETDTTLAVSLETTF
jgi:putative salt-induced outer membrane protein YdiY